MLTQLVLILYSFNTILFDQSYLILADREWHATLFVECQLFCMDLLYKPGIVHMSTKASSVYAFIGLDVS